MEKTAKSTEVMNSEIKSCPSHSLNDWVIVDPVVDGEKDFVDDPALVKIITEGMRKYLIKEPLQQNMHLVGGSERLIGIWNEP